MARKSQRTDFPNYLIKINMLNNKTIDQVSVELFFQHSPIIQDRLSKQDFNILPVKSASVKSSCVFFMFFRKNQHLRALHDLLKNHHSKTILFTAQKSLSHKRFAH